MGIDVGALERLAEGEGTDKVIVTKRWLRAVATELKAAASAGQRKDTFDRIFGSQL